MPVGPARIARRWQDRMLMAFCPGVAPYTDLVNREARQYLSTSAVLADTTGLKGIGRKTDAIGNVIALSPTLSLTAGHDYTCLFVVDGVGFNGANPGVWRDSGGGNFCIFQGTSGRPWIRVNGSNVLQPGSGYGLTSGASHAFAFRVRSSTSAAFFADGVCRHSATHAVATTTASILQIGYQNTGTEALSGGYVLAVFWLCALPDGDLIQLTGNSASLFEDIAVPVWDSVSVPTGVPYWAFARNRSGVIGAGRGF